MMCGCDTLRGPIDCYIRDMRQALFSVFDINGRELLHAKGYVERTGGIQVK